MSNDRNIDSLTNPWVIDEFAGIELGDRRREMRLLSIASELSQHFTLPLPQALSTNAALQGAYRFFANDAIDSEHLLDAHVLSAIQRARESKASVLLSLQDTTELDYSTHKKKKGIGKLGYNYGCLLHNTFLATESGVPLGVLQQLVWARASEEVPKTAAERAKTPIREKESYKWLQSLEQVNEVAGLAPEVIWVSVSDRESDIFEFFAAERASNVELLVRGNQTRNIENSELKLKKAVQNEAVAGHFSFKLPKRGSQKARQVEASVRFLETVLPVSKRLRYQGYTESQKIWAIWVQEESAPKDVEPLSWLLLTTVEVHDFEKALEIVGWYTKRWLIELFHKALKSGCNIEELQLEDLEEIKRALPIYSVLAWRLLYVTMFAREEPNLPATTLFSDDEWKALYCAIHRVPTPPEEVPPLREAVRWIAKLGGFLGRKSDGEPGMIVLWRGLQQLAPRVEMYQIMRPP